MDSQTDESFLLENWMNALRSQLAPLPFTEITMPGAHDANTFSLKSKMLSSLAKCQTLNLYEQAMIGVRFFDIRYGNAKGTAHPVDKHGPFTGGNFLQNFDSLAAFLTTHPNEFIIISFQSEGKISRDQKRQIVRSIVSHFGERLIRGADFRSWFSLERTTFGRIMQSKRRVLVFAREEFWDVDDLSEAALFELGIANAKHMIHSEWHNVSDERTLLVKSLSNLLSRSLHGGRLFCSQFILTPQKNPKKFFSDIIKIGIPGIQKLAGRLTNDDLLANFIAKNIDLNLGIVLLDQIHLFKNVLRMVIYWNNPSVLKIHRVLYGGVDVTDHMTRNLLWQRIFYVQDTAELRAKFKPMFDQLCIVYSVDNTSKKVFQSQVGAKNVLLGNTPTRSYRVSEGSNWVVFWTQNGYRRESCFFAPNQLEVKEMGRLRKANGAIMVDEDNLIVLDSHALKKPSFE